MIGKHPAPPSCLVNGRIKCPQGGYGIIYLGVVATPSLEIEEVSLHDPFNSLAILRR